MKIVYLLPVVAQVRYQKRVLALEQLGASAVVLAFERDYYPGKPWPCGYRSLGRVAHGHYHKRVAVQLGALKRIRAAARATDVIYAFGLDMLLLGWLASRFVRRCPRIVYEVGDIREILTRNHALARVMRWIERFLVRRSDLVVVTSAAYIDGYFHAIQKLDTVPYLVVENKLAAADLQIPGPRTTAPRSARERGKIRIGYFGLIRCRRSWQLLREVLRHREGEIELYLRGIFTGLADLATEIQSTVHVEYGGPYVAPDDLPQLYQEVDMVWIAHYHAHNNFRWARANRFYEACHFRCPMIAQAGTQDGAVVHERKLGAIIDLRDPDASLAALLDLDWPQIAAWRARFDDLPRELFSYTDEHAQLLEQLWVGPPSQES